MVLLLFLFPNKVLLYEFNNNRLLILPVVMNCEKSECSTDESLNLNI